MIRTFTLINEYGQSYPLNQVRKGFLMNPSGLGYAINRNYTLFGSEWIKSDDQIEQTPISGTIYFGSESPYQRSHEFTEFVLTSKELTLSYETPAGTYYKDVDISNYSKTEIGSSGYLECQIELMPKTLWYLPSNVRVSMNAASGNGLQFTFKLPNKFVNNRNGSAIITNDGHVPAPFKMTVYGPISNPMISLLDNGEEISKLRVVYDISAGETLEYSSKDGNIYIYVDDGNGNRTDLATSLDITNDNIFKIPIGTYQIKMTADSALTSAAFTIYKQYIAV